MRKLICCMLVLSNLFFSGCVEKSVQGTKNEQLRNYVTYNIGKMPDDLIMFKNYGIRQQDLLVNLFEGLVTSDDKGRIIPALAESWSLNKDETCYTFKIRDKAKWSDGRDITAADFVSFFSEILSKDMDNIYVQQLYYIFGAEDYKKGKVDFNSVAIRAVDKKTLEIRLNYPCSYLLNILAEPIYSLRRINEDLTQWKKNYKNLGYSGSFKIENISESNELTLRKNSEYWNKDSVKNDEVIISCIDGSEAALAAFENQKTDIFLNPPISEFESLLNSGRVKELPSYSAGALVFNLKKEGIAKDVNFRKSVVGSINRHNIARDILKDTAKPATSYIPPNISDGLNGQYMNKIFLSSEIEKEKSLELIKKSPYENNKELLKLTYIDTVENKKICENIAKDLSENLKIRIECKGYGAEEFADIIKEEDYDIAKVDYEGNYDYPLAFLERWTSSSDVNLYGYNNLEFDTKVIKAKMEKDKAKKIQFLKEAENILMEDVPITPLYFSKNIICKKNDIEGIYTTKRGNIKLDKVYVKVEP